MRGVHSSPSPSFLQVQVQQSSSSFVQVQVRSNTPSKLRSCETGRNLNKEDKSSNKKLVADGAHCDGVNIGLRHAPIPEHVGDFVGHVPGFVNEPR